MDDGAVSSRKILSEEAIPIMREGISLQLYNWDPLGMLVQPGAWCPDYKARRATDKFVDELLAWFNDSSKELHIAELNMRIQKFMKTLKVDVIDVHTQQVAESLMTMYEECLGHCYTSVEKLRAIPRPLSFDFFKDVIGLNFGDISDGADSNVMVDAKDSKPSSGPAPASVKRCGGGNINKTDQPWDMVACNRSKKATMDATDSKLSSEPAATASEKATMGAIDSKPSSEPAPAATASEKATMGATDSKPSSGQSAAASVKRSINQTDELWDMLMCRNRRHKKTAK